MARPRHGAAAALLHAFVAGLVTGGCGTDAPGQARLLATSGFTDQVFVLAAETGEVTDSLPLDPRPGEIDEPHAVAVSPEGRHWYATVSHGEPTLWKFEAGTNRLVGRLTLPLPGAGRIGITPDGARAFVPDYFRAGLGAVSHLAVVRLHDLALEARIPLCPAPHDAAVDPDGRRVAVTCTLSDEIVVLDAETLDPLGRWPVGPDPGAPGAPRYRPMNVVWLGDGRALAVTLMAGDALGVYEPTGETLAHIPVGAAPAQLAVAPGRRRVVVANRADASLSLVDVDGKVEVRRIPLVEAPHPHGVAVEPERPLAYVTYEGDITTPGGVLAVELESGSLVWRRQVGLYTLGVAWVPGRGGA